MKKKEFIDLLKYYLKSMPKNVVDDIVDDYEEHFSFGKERGKTEEQICDELGSPEQIAYDYINNEKMNFNEYKTNSNDDSQDYNYRSEYKKSKRETSNIFLIILALIGGIILIGPAAAFLASIIIFLLCLIFGVFFLGIGAILFGFTLPLSFIPAVVASPLISYPPILMNLSPITKILATITLVLFGILIIMFTIHFIKWIIELFKKMFIAIKWEIQKRRK